MQVKKKIILSILLAIIAGLYSINYFRNVHTISTSGDIAFHFARVKGLSSIFLVQSILRRLIIMGAE